MVNHHTLTTGIVWMIIAILLSIEVAVAIDATAQVRLRRRRRFEMPEQSQGNANTKVTTDFGEYVLEIARGANGQAQNLTVDLAFVIDANPRMMGAITELRKKLIDVADMFDEGLIDYRFAQTSFRKLDGVPRISVQPLASDLVGSQEWFRKLRQSARNSAPGYGLDAILQTLREINFRSEASKHLLVVTYSHLQTAWAVENAQDKIVKEIVDQCKRDEIYINIIGVREPAQIQLTTETGGKFYSISDNDRSGVKFPHQRSLDESISRTEGIFKLIAQHIAATVTQPSDIIFMSDSSLSMKTKVDKICRGIDEMVNVLDTAGVDYRFGVIRFWAESGGGQSVVLSTKPPLAVDQVKRLFRLPKRGDEHLLHAVMEGVPELRTPTDRQLVLVIVTDEPTSHRVEKGYTIDQAIGVCRRAEAQVNVIGASSRRSDAQRGNKDMIRVGKTHQRIDMFINYAPSAAFQKRVTKATNGLFYVMPGSAMAADPRR